MAKSLGMIHTVNHRLSATSDSARGQIDLARLLQEQLQKQIRQGQYFKVVGIDMTLTDYDTGDNGGQVSGWLNYFTPTRGRCKAYRSAFAAMKTAMKLQGINMHDNKLYDFRVGLRDNAKYAASQQIKNIATLNGVDPLSLIDGSASNAEIFNVYNEGVAPIATATPNFGAGFNTMGVQSTPTDFVLEDQNIQYYGNEDFANGTVQQIPFQLSYTPGSTDISVSLQWRPDPALYVAVLAGLIEIEIDELDFDGNTDALNFDLADRDWETD